MTPTLTPGCRLRGGTYAGICTAKTGELYALVMLDAKPGKRLPWQAAMDWAQSQGGDLPSRPEAALLLQHLKPQLDPRWHWTNETARFSASCAWYCYFRDGHQLNYRKNFEGSAIAVLRIPLNSYADLAALAQEIES